MYVYQHNAGDAMPSLSRGRKSDSSGEQAGEGEGEGERTAVGRCKERADREARMTADMLCKQTPESAEPCRAHMIEPKRD